MRSFVVSVLVAFPATGCAGLEMKDLKSDTEDKDAKGFRYYDTSPFLLVYTDAKGGLKSEVLYLPDTQKKRSIRPYSYAAKNDATFKFENGRLAGANAVVDETVVPVAAISALEKIATSMIKAANAGVDGIPPPYLFRIRLDESGWKLSGDQAIGVDSKPTVIRYNAP